MGRCRALAAAVLAAVGIHVLSTGTARADPCGRVRFITIYDSHGLTPFGDQLDAQILATPGAELTSYTLGGASPGWLLRGALSPRGYLFKSCEGKPILPRSRLPKQSLRTPAIDTLLRVPEGRYERQVVILTLGSNVPGFPAVQTAPVERIVRSINARPEATCIWIGPPPNRRWTEGYTDRVYAAIRDGIRAAGAGRRRGRACHLIDSRLLTPAPTGWDGTHFGFSAAGVEGARRWADAVGREIDRILRARPAPSRGRRERRPGREVVPTGTRVARD
jgi:hypothetical protein